MRRWRVPLSVPEIGEAEKRALVEALDSGWPSAGPRVAAFEAAFAEAVGVAHAVAVSSGTAALHLLLRTLDLGPGDEVVVPSLSFVATANAVVAAGGRPVFADVVSPEEPCLDASTVEAVLSPRTRGVVAVHYAGVPCEMEGLRALAAGRRLALFEDAAHACGAWLDGRAAGALGDAAAFSFYATKNLTTIEGGMVSTADPERARRVRRLASHGLGSLSWERHQGGSPDRDVEEPGLNYRMDDLRAALGLAQLPVLAARNARRAEVLARYAEAAASRPGLSFAFPALRPGRASSAHLAPLLVAEGAAARDALARRLEERGIQTSRHYRPSHLMSCYRSAERRLPVTEDFAAREISLPLFSTIAEEQVDLVCEALS